MDYYSMTDKGIGAEIGNRIRSLRLRKNLTQQALADRAALSVNAIKALESGKGKLLNLIAVLRELDALFALDNFIPESAISPSPVGSATGKKATKGIREEVEEHRKGKRRMVEKVDTAIVRLWGEMVGAVAWLADKEFGVFEYDPAFLKRGLDISPLHMALAEAGRGNSIFSFPGLNKETFLGLPGLLADALPDKFGNSIIDAWLVRNGRDAGSFSPIERLCYTGKRAMGALEFEPPINRRFDRPVSVEVSELVELAQNIMAQRLSLDVDIGESERENSQAIMDILRVGTSAGGARPKPLSPSMKAGM